MPRFYRQNVPAEHLRQEWSFTLPCRKIRLVLVDEVQKHTLHFNGLLCPLEYLFILRALIRPTACLVDWPLFASVAILTTLSRYCTSCSFMHFLAESKLQLNFCALLVATAPHYAFVSLKKRPSAHRGQHGKLFDPHNGLIVDSLLL
jgi:hypothetical protein